MFLENQLVDERISRAIDNDHTAAMKANGDGKKHMKKKGSKSFSTPDSVSVCGLCKKVFKNNIVYRKHLRLHLEKPFVCLTCGKNFLYKHYLKTHLLTHSKLQQFQCHVCHKHFTQKGNLNQHLKFHTTKKMFKCDICTKDFYQQEHLKAHLRHHNNERPFVCEICHKAFNIKSSLQRHMNCHTGAKPFICDICNRGYTRRSVLMLHVQQVHENKKPFQCDECQLCFSQKGNLQAHFRRKHLQPKSDGRRGKSKDDVKGKRGIKRPKKNSRSFCGNKNFIPFISYNNSADEHIVKKKLSKIKVENAQLLHSYASKVKAIINVSNKPSEKQNNGKSSSEKSELPCSSDKESDQSVSGIALTSIKKEDPSSSSDDALDMLCSSSSCDSTDIPDLNFPNMLDNHVDTLSDFDTILNDNKGWDAFLEDSENPNSITNYELSEILSSPVKANVILSKYGSDTSEELFPNLSWTLSQDFASTQPLFLTEEFDDFPTGKSMAFQSSLDNLKKQDLGQEMKQSNRITMKNQANRKAVNYAAA